MGNNHQYPPHPSLIREGSNQPSPKPSPIGEGEICHPELVSGSQEIQKPGSQPALEKMLKHGGQSDVQHYINLFLKRTYSPVHLFSYSLRKRAAFTLAEVLITLGIIGVVAAMTIPTLISNHNKRVVETRLKKFYSSMNQAIP